MSLSSVTLAGASISLTDVVANVSISHGRTDIAQPGTASTCTLTVVIDQNDAIPATVGDDLVIQSHSVDRFTGTVSAVSLDHHSDGTTFVNVTAVGTLDLLTFINTGLDGFSEESFETRADAILNDTGLPYMISSDDATTLVAEDALATTAAQYLTNLCAAVGATMCDLPDGNILLQTYTMRLEDYAPDAWSDASGTWSAATGSWRPLRQLVELPPTAVTWEPIWNLRTDTIVNDVTITYGSADPQDTVTDTDTTSVSVYGKRSAYLSTGIKTQSVAEARAGNILTAQASPRWRISDATVLVDELDTTTRAKVLDIVSGDRVILDGLPGAAPDILYFGIVEGWTETHTPEGHRLTLYLSDPRYSYAMAPWSDAGSATWSAAIPSWSDAVLASDLT